MVILQYSLLSGIWGLSMGYFIGTFGCENLLYIMVIFVSGMIYEGWLKQLKNMLIFMIIIRILSLYLFPL